MCQEDDGPISGQLYLTINGQQLKLRGTKSSHWFTLVCITAGTGDVVVFIIIFAAKELYFVAQFGYDHRATDLFDLYANAANQVGEDKEFSGLL